MMLQDGVKNLELYFLFVEILATSSIHRDINQASD